MEGDLSMGTIMLNGVSYSGSSSSSASPYEMLCNQHEKGWHEITLNKSIDNYQNIILALGYDTIIGSTTVEYEALLSPVSIPVSIFKTLDGEDKFLSTYNIKSSSSFIGAIYYIDNTHICVYCDGNDKHTKVYAQQ